MTCRICHDRNLIKARPHREFNPRPYLEHCASTEHQKQLAVYLGVKHREKPTKSMLTHYFKPKPKPVEPAASSSNPAPPAASPSNPAPAPPAVSSDADVIVVSSNDTRKRGRHRKCAGVYGATDQQLHLVYLYSRYGKLVCFVIEIITWNCLMSRRLITILL